VTASDPVPFLDHLARESARFRAVLADAPGDLTVPTCPDWTVDDLLLHLADVQWFWGGIAQRRLTRRDEVAAMSDDRPDPPDDRAARLRFFDDSTARLQRELAGLEPEIELWMWADDHTCAYVRRRQAHEALIHRLDAELAVGARTDLDPALSADGVDEALRIMRGWIPDPHEPGVVGAPVSGPVTVVTVDTMHAWTVTPLNLTGTDADGDGVDTHRFAVEDGPRVDAVARVSGTAADLDCWLWNRPTVGAVIRQGDEAALAAVDLVIAGDVT
jgi:uncharacterized protein (TIGR03083 family)